MSLFERLERALERLVEGGPAGSAGERAHPVEIARLLTRHMQAQRRVGVGRVYVPNVYDVFLSTADYASFRPIARELEAEMTACLAREAVQRDYAVSGPLRVVLTERASVGEGDVQLEARFERTDGAEVAPTVEIGPAFAQAVALPSAKAEIKPQKPRAVLMGTGGFVNGIAVRLEPDSIVVGRLPACGVHVPDAQVSKEHARLDWNGETYVLTSTGRNGTSVNGRQITEPATLRHGDEILVGGSSLCYRLLPAVTPRA